jgi:hypothetical protein
LNAQAADAATGRRVLFGLFVTAAIIAAASLLWVGEATSRDTNNWLIWARQLSLGHSLDFSGGVPSWKPLPVLVSLPFARVSPSAANLFWLWLVRFSFLSCSVLLGTLVVDRFGRFAAVIAGLLPLALPTWFAFALMGDSEPVATALTLSALLAAAHRRPRLAFLLLTAAGLLRPELWLLLAVLAVWQWHRDKKSAAVYVAASATALFVGWSLIPELAGGDWTQAASRASTRLLVANQADGFFTLLPMRAWLLVAVGAFAVWQRRDRFLGVLGIASLGLAVEVEVMSWFGFSGLDRYVMPGAIGLCAIAGAGAGTLTSWPRPAWARWTVGLIVSLIVGGLIWSAVPLDRDNVAARRQQGQSANRAVEAFNAAGGLKEFGNCRPLATNGAWSVILARMLGLPLHDVVNNTVAPTVTLQPLNLRSRANGPLVRGIAKQPQVVGYARPDWAVVLYPGCETNAGG